jgi:hypothetical protein
MRKKLIRNIGTFGVFTLLSISILISGCESPASGTHQTAIQQKTALATKDNRTSREDREDTAFWYALQTNTVAGFQQFIAEYPSGTRRSHAEALIRELRRSPVTLEEAFQQLKIIRLDTSCLNSCGPDFRQKLTELVTAKFVDLGYSPTTDPTAPQVYVFYSYDSFAVGTPKKTIEKIGDKQITRVETPDLRLLDRYTLTVSVKADTFKASRDFKGEVTLPMDDEARQQIYWQEVRAKLLPHLNELPKCRLSTQEPKKE